MFGRGPRTTETKGEASEVWRPLRLCIGTMLAGWALISGLTFLAWLNETKIYAWFFEHRRAYWSLYVIWMGLRILALISRWSREMSDEDFTSLQMQNHPLRGILPLTATTRWLFILLAIGERYWWGRKTDVPSGHNEEDHFQERSV